MDELSKPSRGTELIEELNKEEKNKKEDGVEVTDVKAIPKRTYPKLDTDKFSILIPKNRRTWDKI